MKKILVVGAGDVGRTTMTEALISKGIENIMVIESEKERGIRINPAFEKESMMITRSTYHESYPIYNPNPPKRGSNRQPKKKKRKRKGHR